MNINTKLLQVNSKYFSVFFISLLFVLNSCDQQKELKVDLLSKTVENYGGSNFFKSSIKYTSGNFDYEINRDQYRKEIKIFRLGKDSTMYTTVLKDGIITEFTNDIAQSPREDGHALLTRTIDGFVYSNSIPHVLTANDIEIEEQGKIKIGSKIYEILYAKTKFVEDIDISHFYLYLDPETYNIMFSAQDYLQESAKPIFKRFYNHRTINGIRFADYTNFKPKENTFQLSEMIKFFNADYFEPIKEVTFTNISVDYLVD